MYADTELVCTPINFLFIYSIFDIKHFRGFFETFLLVPWIMFRCLQERLLANADTGGGLWWILEPANPGKNSSRTRKLGSKKPKVETALLDKNPQFFSNLRSFQIFSFSLTRKLFLSQLTTWTA